MAKTLDFNSVQRPTMELTMKDADRTRFRVSTPKEYLIEELQALSRELEEIVHRGSTDGILAVFDLAAKLISCNRDYIKVTGSDLRGKYNMDLEDVILFFGAYMDFISEINNAKN